MPKEIFTEQFIVTIQSDRKIENLADHVMGRLWSLDHVLPTVDAKPILGLNGATISSLTVSVPDVPTGTPIGEDFVFTSTDELVEKAVATFKPLDEEVVTLRMPTELAEIVANAPSEQIRSVLERGISTLGLEDSYQPSQLDSF